MKKLLFLLLCFITAGVTALNAQTTCNAGFGWQANPNGNNLLNVDFTNTSTGSTSPGSPYTQTSIDFGDGSSVGYFYNMPNLSHNYAAPGSYTATVIIETYDSSSAGMFLSCSDTATSVVTVSNSPCASTVAYQYNGSGSYTFTASNPAGTSGMTYSWDFGDNTSGTGNSVTHTYNAGGNFTVTLTSTGGGCTYTNTNTINSNISPAFDCNSAAADFSSVVSNSAVAFTNTSSGNQGNNEIINNSNWDFGDGNYGSTYYSQIAHNYAAIGTYTVSLENYWLDSLTNQNLCMKTVSHTVTITSLTPPSPSVNMISGMVTYDTLINNVQSGDSIKIWLIVHDTTANTLIATDSQYVDVAYASYSFYNAPTGDYLVKAAYLNQAAGSAGFLPTYHLASVYWSSATNISHTGGATTGKDIHLQNGTVTSGPGFIGGNISAGAGRGTGTGVNGMLVYLRGSNNQLIASAVTDDDGNYTFTDIATGTYSVYPEAINYNTTPFNTIDVTSSQPHVEAIDFERTETEIKPKSTTGIAKINGKDGLKIYPNPAKNSITIENQNGLFSQVKILNAVGQFVKEVNLKNGINKVDITEINAGIYYLLISGTEGSRAMKFVKQ